MKKLLIIYTILIAGIISCLQPCQANQKSVKQILNEAAPLLDSGQFTAVEQKFFEAAKLHPEDPTIWVIMAIFYDKTGQYEKTLKVTKKIQKSFPGHLSEIVEAHNHSLANTAEADRKYAFLSIVKNTKKAVPKPPRVTSSRKPQKATSIYKRCSKKWATDYEMVEYCVKNQSQAKRSVSRLTNNGIKGRCQNKWPNDYEMVEYCFTNQSDALKRVKRLSNNGIKKRCQEKWNPDYEMVEYCFTNQTKAKNNLARSKYQ